MTLRQKVLKAIYPALTGYKKLFGIDSKVLSNARHVAPVESFYDLFVTLNSGQQLRFDQLRGKKVLLVNTASNCGYTAQYGELEKLYEQEKSRLVIIGFPANDFHEQEKGSDQEIARFCRANFGVDFPLAVKASVVKGSQQQKVFQWLTDSTKNGWNQKPPPWNFSKYLVNESGVLINYFGPSVSPVSDVVTKAVAQ